jgi:hypothetical protein
MLFVSVCRAWAAGINEYAVLRNLGHLGKRCEWENKASVRDKRLETIIVACPGRARELVLP